MELITPRLVLREFCENDAEALFAIYGDAENRRFESQALTLAETQERLNLLLSDQVRTPKISYPFAITVSPGDEARGWIRLTLVNTAIREFEIGWAVRRSDWGKGYATEAAQEVLGLAFNRLHAQRVVAFCRADNRASQRVMEKLGMHSEGLLRETRWLDETWWNERVYAILEREFAARPKI